MKQYAWAVNKLKLERAIKKFDSADEAQIKAYYIQLGGLVRELPIEEVEEVKPVKRVARAKKIVPVDEDDDGSDGISVLKERTVYAPKPQE